MELNELVLSILSRLSWIVFVYGVVGIFLVSIGAGNYAENLDSYTGCLIISLLWLLFINFMKERRIDEVQ